MGKRIIVFALIFMLSFTGGTQKKNGTQDNSAAIDKSPDKSAALRDGGITQPLPEPASASHPTAVPLSVPEHPSGGMPGEKPPEEIPVEVLISFAGDCTIGTDESFSYVNSFPYRFEKVGGDYSYFFKGVRSVFQNDDLTLVNLETTLTTAKKKAKKTFRFKGEPSYVNILTEGGVEMVNISNNHIYDYLEQGFQETLEVLSRADVDYSGEGQIAYYEAKGITIASIGYSWWSTGIKDGLAEDIETARSKADIVIVSFHWGKERSYYPNSTQITLGRYAVDRGADIVVGHHPHVIQGIDYYKGKYIVYSLGNFCFGGNRNPADKDTFIFQNKFLFLDGELSESQGIIHPCSLSSTNHVNDFQPVLLEGEDGERVINRILEYSGRLKYGIKREDVIFGE